jgi:hypothetical protein
MTRSTRSQGPPEDDVSPENEAANVLPLAVVRKSPAPRPRIARLFTTRACLMEISRIYRAARTGQMQWADAARATYIIKAATEIITGAEVEDRLAALEEKAPAP